MSKLVKNPEVDKLNERLKAANLHVSVEQRDDRLYLRGTFPPKPGSGKVKPHSQRVALGVYANAGGIKAAWKVALKAASDIADKSFDWSEWLTVKQSDTPQSVSDWVEAFEQDYFTRRARTPKSQTTWDKDYRDPFRKLPSNAALTAEVLLSVIAQTSPDTRSRQRFCAAYGALARFAGLELNTSRLRGKYSPKAVNPRDLPSDQLITEWRDCIPRKDWQWVYSMIAAYGLRPHETFHVDLESVRKTPLIRVLEGKTGFHLALPVLPQWWEEWRLYECELPVLNVKSNRDYGLRCGNYFREQVELPFRLYDLRHAWSARAARLGLADAIAAKLQGHSPQIHAAVYQQWMDGNHFLAAWEHLKQRVAAEDA